MKQLSYHRHEFPFPPADEPAWKGTVERWYQLDAQAYALADAGHAWRELPRPDLILLASPGASNESDVRFASSGATSPSRFVHTLPNVRASSLLQVLTWVGPVLCVQKDPGTVVAALGEAFVLSSGGYPTIWTCGARNLGQGRYEAYLFLLGQDTKSTLRLEDTEPSTEGEVDWAPVGPVEDARLFQWLSRESVRPGEGLSLSPFLKMVNQ